jgi:hypothetical protein
MRAAGYNRQAMQTHYVGESGIAGGTAWMNQVGAQSTWDAMQRTTMARMAPIELMPFEPNVWCPGDLRGCKHVYRLATGGTTADRSMEGPAGQVLIDRDSIGGARQAWEPLVMVDVYDGKVLNDVFAGERSDGRGAANDFLEIVVTSRGRTRLPGVDFEGSVTPEVGDELFHEGASDARAYVRLGPADLPVE